MDDSSILQPMPSGRALRLVRTRFTDRPAFDTAVSHAILLRVAAGELPDTLRFGRPGAMVAFGRQDATGAGYGSAVREARDAGFEAIERLAGGRAAVFHENTIAFACATREEEPGAGIHARFEEVAGIVVSALDRLGVDARAGEVPGEYCPGAYSVSSGGRRKLMGVGQRLIKHGAHLGGVVVVSEPERVRDVLVPVYRALGLDWDPATAGAISDDVPSIDWEKALEVLIDQFGTRYELVEESLDQETLTLAERLEPEHVAPPLEEDDLVAGGR
jgi:octanoyl-[GcvH]:protein N-octanoyltransferase